MYQNKSQIVDPLATPNKIIRQKPPNTPGSKHKDRLIIQESYKKRQSMRRSFHRKIAWMQAVCKPKQRKKRNNRKIDTQQSFDFQLANRIQSATINTIKRQQYIEELTKKIINTQQIIAQIKNTKEKARQIFFQQKQLTRFLKQSINQTNQQCFRIRNQTNNIHFDTKKYIFQIASQQFNITKTLQQNQQHAKKKQQKLNQILEQFQITTQVVTQSQLKLQDLQKELSITKQNFRTLTQNSNLQFSQLFVLKFQINSNLLIGMHSSANGLEKKIMLEKEVKNWDRNKQKKIQFIDLKRWIIIQLYRGWKNILRKLSYQSSQYQVLFGQVTNQPVLQDLKRFLSQDKIRSSYRKFQKSLIFYSQLKIPYPYRQQIKTQLSSFNNNLIKINNIQFIQFQGNTEMQIYYTYLQQQQLVQRFTYEEYNIVNKQKIMKDLKNTQRRICCIIQIPLAAHKDDIMRYEEVYEIVKKKRGNQGVVSQRSLSK